MAPSGLLDAGLGDWVPVKSKAPKEFTTTAYFYADVVVLAKAARLFSNTVDAEKYSALADKIKNAFNKKYLNKETGLYGTGLQTELSVALFWALFLNSIRQKPRLF